MTRLIDMDIEPFLVASAIDCVVAQRLARKLCQFCKERTIVAGAGAARQRLQRRRSTSSAYEPVGCGRCNGMGYKGRLGLYEVMSMTEEIRTLVLQRAPADEIAAVATREGMHRLRDDGFEKVKAGLTSLAEVARVDRDTPTWNRSVSTQTHKGRKLAKISQATTIASMQTSKTVTTAGLAEDLQRFFARVMKGDQGELFALIAELDLTMPQMRGLFVIDNADHALALTELAPQMGLSVAAAGRSVDGLVRNGARLAHRGPGRPAHQAPRAHRRRARRARAHRRGAPRRAAALRRHARRRRARRARATALEAVFAQWDSEQGEGAP